MAKAKRKAATRTTKAAARKREAAANRRLDRTVRASRARQARAAETVRCGLRRAREARRERAAAPPAKLWLDWMRALWGPWFCAVGNRGVEYLRGAAERGLTAAQVWREAPDDLKAAFFDRVQPAFYRGERAPYLGAGGEAWRTQIAALTATAVRQSALEALEALRVVTGDLERTAPPPPWVRITKTKAGTYRFECVEGGAS